MLNKAKSLHYITSLTHRRYWNVFSSYTFLFFRRRTIHAGFLERVTVARVAVSTRNASPRLLAGFRDSEHPWHAHLVRGPKLSRVYTQPSPRPGARQKTRGRKIKACISEKKGDIIRSTYIRLYQYVCFIIKCVISYCCRRTKDEPVGVLLELLYCWCTAVRVVPV